MTPEQGDEGWFGGEVFFSAWTAGSSLFPFPRRRSQKVQTGVIVAAFPIQVVDKMQRETIAR